MLTFKLFLLEKTLSPKLLEWFGNSKVVDSSGNPLAVYHGSKSAWFTRFDMSKVGSGVVNSGVGGAIFFTSEKENAKFYADYTSKRKADVDSVGTYGNEDEYYYYFDDMKGKNITSDGPYATEDEAMKHGIEDANNYNKHIRKDTFTSPYYLRIENPLVLDSYDTGVKQTISRAKAAGHDGVIISDVFDGDRYSDVYIIFSTFQVKSARYNNGSYSKETDHLFK